MISLANKESILFAWRNRSPGDAVEFSRPAAAAASEREAKGNRGSLYSLKNLPTIRLTRF
jgi:hypothetical protein